MVGKYNAIILIVILVFATLFLLLYASESVRISIPTIPALTEDQAKDVMETDIEKRVGNVSVRIYSNSTGEPLPLIYYRHEGNMAFRINEKSHGIMGSCNPSLQCFLNNKEEVLASIDRRLFYFVDGSYSGEDRSSPAYYYIDAMNGDILWSYIGEDVYPELTSKQS